MNGSAIPPLPAGYQLDQSPKTNFAAHAGNPAIPPVPPGYKLDQTPHPNTPVAHTRNSGIPPVPAGYKLDQSAGVNHPPLPPGYTLDQPSQKPTQNNASQSWLSRKYPVKYLDRAMKAAEWFIPGAAATIEPVRGFIENTFSGEEDPNKFGAGRSFAAAFGLPTSMQEVRELQRQQEANRPKTLGQFGKQLGKAALQGAVGPGGQVIQGAYRGLKETLPQGKREIDDAAKNIAQGGPIFPNFLKATLGSLTAQSGLLAPVGGRTLMRAGEQFATGASGIPGTKNPFTGTEIANPFSGNWQGGIGSTGAVIAPWLIGESISRSTKPMSSLEPTVREPLAAFTAAKPEAVRIMKLTDGSEVAIGPKIGPPTIEALETRVQEVHRIPHPIAQRMRTTAGVATVEGPTVFGAGAKADLIPLQRAALKEGELPAKLRWKDAEVTALRGTFKKGLTPKWLVATRPICDECKVLIESTGGTLINKTTAVWPH